MKKYLCQSCKKPVNIGILLRTKKPTRAQREASRINGAKSRGRPRKAAQDQSGL